MTGLNRLNTATKYPSIETYHALERGILTEEAMEFKGSVYLTEKVDGTNGRIVFMPDGTDYYIGSRENLLYAKGDRVINPTLGIVDALRPIADRLTSDTWADTGIPYFGTSHTATVLYAEVYGHKIGGAAKHYTKAEQVGVRMFDLCAVNLAEMASASDLAAVAAWRDREGGQSWYTEDELRSMSTEIGVPLTPRLVLSPMDGMDLPVRLGEMYEWMKILLPSTLVALDGAGESEGIVLRTEDRGTIAKARFEDYLRTARKVGKK